MTKKGMNRFVAKYIILFLFWLSMDMNINAQPTENIKLVHFSGTNKMPGESVQCLFQDRIGIFWLGAESLGLTKFDGKNYTLYRHDPLDSTTISSGYPVRVVEDKLGQIWVATNNGLNKFNRYTEKFTRFYFSETDSNTLSNNILNDMIIDQSGFIWIASTNGITILNPEKEEFKRILYNSNLSLPAYNYYINTLHLDANNNLWIGSTLHGMYKIASHHYEPFIQEWKEKSITEIRKTITITRNWKTILQKSNINNILSISSSTPDSVWIGSQAGLYFFNAKSEVVKKKVLKKPNHSHLNLTSFHVLHVDRQNKLWAGTSNNGLVVLDLKTDTYQYLNADNYLLNNLKSNAIRAIKELNNGMIWVATKFAGLHYYDPRQQTFPLISKVTIENTGLNDDFVISSIEDDYHNIWIGTKTGGLNKYNRTTNTFRYFTADGRPGSIKSNRIEDLALDKKGTVWVATQSGLESYNPQNKMFNLHLQLHIRNLHCTKDNYLWMGTTNGLYRFSIQEKKLAPLKSKHVDFFDVENNISITRVLEDSKGVLWIATSNNGLFEYHSQTDSLINHLHNTNDDFSISGNLVREIFEDSKNRLWIGTKSNGLNLFDRQNRKFHHVKVSRELASSTVYHILEDKNGNLWMGTHNGIFTYNPEDESYFHYTTIHGLQSLIFEINAYTATHDGYFLMGGNHGINMFNPLNVKLENEHAPLIITNINLLNKTLARDISELASLVIDNKSNYLSFEFALLDYSNPLENSYAYKLSPFDSDWVESGTRNYATYTNLPPGKYTFSVKGYNSLGINNNNTPVTIEIIIPAPLWKKWWFTPLIILLIIGTLILSNQIRLMTIKRREEQLKLIVKERTKDLLNAYQKLEDSKRQIENHNQELLLQKDQISRQNKELEEHRNHLELKVANRTKDLEKEKKKAEESDRLKSAFLANMSHEIRTPLNAIVGFIDLMEVGQIEDDQKNQIHEIIRSNSDALLQLINDIVDISMIEANQMTIKKREVNFNKFLYGIRSHYLSNKQLASGHVELILSIPENTDNLIVFTAPERVNQIFTNLINNAIKFTEKGYISFGYELNNASKTLTCFVKDTGCGITKENQKLLFERFRKIDVDHNKVHRGTGLGLSISKNLSELLGGNIWVESEPGKGSAFYFNLPIAESHS